jgi:hypothetical protein
MMDLAYFAEGTPEHIVNATLDDKVIPAADQIRAIAFVLTDHKRDLSKLELGPLMEIIHDLADGIVEHARHALPHALTLSSAPAPQIAPVIVTPKRKAAKS